MGVMDVLSSFANILFSIAFIFGPTSGYYFQYKLVKRTGSLGSFSTDVCAILIFSNILRIFFWFCQKFDIALLFQSIVMLIVQLLLLKECIEVKPKRFFNNKAEEDEFDKYSLTNFWRWDDYRTYIEITVGVALACSLLTFLFSDNVLYSQTIGTASVMIEACLGLPQLLSNRKNKSTAGLSMGLIFTWFAGDLAKTLFFVTKDQPIQFVMCGVTQLLIDIWILGQIRAYRGNSYEEVKSE